MRMYVGRRIYGRNYVGVSFPIKANYIVAWILGSVVGFIIVAITFASCIAIHNSPSAIEERERAYYDMNNYDTTGGTWYEKSSPYSRISDAEAWKIIKHNHLEDKYPEMFCEIYNSNIGLKEYDQNDIENFKIENGVMTRVRKYDAGRGYVYRMKLKFPEMLGAAEAWEIIKHNHLEDKYPEFNIEK